MHKFQFVERLGRGVFASGEDFSLRHGERGLTAVRSRSRAASLPVPSRQTVFKRNSHCIFNAKKTNNPRRIESQNSSCGGYFDDTKYKLRGKERARSKEMLEYLLYDVQDTLTDFNIYISFESFF